MSAALERYREEMLRLTKEERQELAEFLASSVDEEIYGPVDSPGVVEAEWEAELKRRVEEVASGRAKLISGEQVMDEMKKSFP